MTRLGPGKGMGSELGTDGGTEGSQVAHIMSIGLCGLLMLGLFVSRLSLSDGVGLVWHSFAGTSFFCRRSIYLPGG